MNAGPTMPPLKTAVAAAAVLLAVAALAVLATAGPSRRVADGAPATSSDTSPLAR